MRQPVSAFLALALLLAGAPQLAAAEDSPAAPRVDHIAFVVEDIEVAARLFADTLGVAEPAIVTTESLGQNAVCYRGKPTEAAAKLAFLPMQNVTIELIEPVAGESAWSDFLAETGGGLHHVTLRVEDLDDGVVNLETKGGKLLQAGSFRGGRYAYLDMSEQLRIVLELLALAPQPQ